MNAYEELFAGYGIPVPAGKVASTAEQAAEAAKALGGDQWVVKAQIHAGGRGKAGGVKLCKTAADVYEKARAMLGQVLVTKQTGPDGRLGWAYNTARMSRALIRAGMDRALAAV